jgi:phospholipase/lecithinase/hemolysin
VQNVNNFTTLTNATNALFVVWVIDADFVYDIANYGPYTSNNIAIWTNAINLSLTNHYKAITNLYAKGARTLIMPNAADITEIPAYNIMAATNKSFIRQRIIDFNTAFTTTLMNRIQTSCPGITIYVPDIFTLLNNVLTNAAAYGLTNALDNGLSIDALDDPSLSDLSLNGPGANYIFWDDEDPTARFHSVIAGVVQQLISPAQITNFTVLNGSNQLDVANVPIGLNGLVLGCTNLSAPSWTTNATFVSSNATQTVFVPASGSPQMFYQLYFPYTWTWP